MMTVSEAAEAAKGLTFETVWLTMQELSKDADRRYAELTKLIKEQRAETDRQRAETDRLIKEQRAETDRLIKEQQAETDRQRAENDRRHVENDRIIKEMRDDIKKMEASVDRVSKNVGGLNRSMGALVETLIAARLWEKFPEYGLKRAYQRLPIYDEKNILKTDIDILLVNTDLCMAIEVKHELNKMDEVKRHLKRMQLIRQYPPGLVYDKHRLLGAMAGASVDPDVKDYAYKCGFFVLELSGESVHLIQPPDGFVPKAW